MRRPRRWLAGWMMVGVAVSGCSGEDAPAVEVARVTTGEVVEVVAAPATIEPRARTPVVAPLGGDVTDVLVADGDEVAAGEPLVSLSSDSIDLQVAQAEAAAGAAGELSSAAAPAVDLSPLFEVVRGQLDAVVPDVLVALEEQVHQIEDDQLRAEAQERVDRATTNYQQSRNELLEAEQEARASADRATQAQRAAAEAQRRQAEAALEAARQQAEELTIVAPADGVVELGRVTDGVGGVGAALGEAGLAGPAGALSGSLPGSSDASGGPVAPGATVGYGQTIATVFDLSGFHVRADVDELDAVAVETGQPVTVLVDAYPDAVLRGEVGRVAIAPTQAGSGAVVFPVEVQLGRVPPDVSLRVGLTASVEIAVARVEGTVVRSSALLRRGGQEVVYVVRDGVAREVAVDVLAIGDDTAAVDGDVAAGDRVAVAGIEDLEDGDPVE